MASVVIRSSSTDELIGVHKDRALETVRGPRVSVALMCHRTREQYVEELVAQLPQVEVVWDEHEDRWDTGARSMQAHDERADWHLVVQDDAVLCNDFMPGVQEVLQHVPQAPVSFYVGQVQPGGQLVVDAVTEARENWHPFLVMPGPLWGVAVAMPTDLITPMLQGCERLSGIANYDQRMGTWLTRERIDCWYTVPSLVDHRPGPSLVPGRTPSRERHAFNFVEKSPLHVDWTGEPLHVSLNATDERSTMRVAPTTIYGVDGSGIRRRIPAGAPIPPGVKLEKPLPPVDTAPEEEKLLRKEQTTRAQAAVTKAAPAVVYEDLTRKELRKLAQERGLSASTRDTKAQLVELLEGASE